MSFVAWSLYTALGLLVTIVTITAHIGATGGFRVIGFLNATQVTVGLLLLSISAVTSLAEERASGSLDVLLSTPLSTVHDPDRQMVGRLSPGPFRAGLARSGGQFACLEEWTLGRIPRVLGTDACL